MNEINTVKQILEVVHNKWRANVVM